MVTARTTPPYVLCWLALASLGAVTVATDPTGTLDELTGLVRQVLPRVIVTDAALRPLVVDARGQLAVEVLDLDELLGDWTIESAVAEFPLEGSVGPDDLAVLIPTSGTTGRSKLVMQTHRAFAMAGVGFPYWMELTAEDRLMTSLPLFHINAPAYSVLGSLAVGSGPGPAAPVLGRWVPGLGPPPWSDRVQRHRGDVGDPDAAAGPGRRRRERPEALLHRPLPDT